MRNRKFWVTFSLLFLLLLNYQNCGNFAESARSQGEIASQDSTTIEVPASDEAVEPSPQDPLNPVEPNPIDPIPEEPTTSIEVPTSPGDIGDSPSPAPPQPPGPQFPNAKSIAVGRDHVCAVNDQSRVVCWGKNSSGQLGNGTRTSSRTPVIASNLSDVVSVVAGMTGTCALTNQGRVYCWGIGGSGGLQTTPLLVQGLPPVKQISLGSYHACALAAESDEVWCWGDNSGGQLGTGTFNRTTIPVKVMNLLNIKQVSVGSYFSCAVDNSGSVYCWGENGAGELGVNTRVNSAVPLRVIGLQNVNFVASGRFSSCAVRNDSRAFCWGTFADSGQLNRFSPLATEIAALNGADDLSVGWYFGIAADERGRIFSSMPPQDFPTNWTGGQQVATYLFFHCALITTEPLVVECQGTSSPYGENPIFIFNTPTRLPQ